MLHGKRPARDPEPGTPSLKDLLKSTGVSLPPIPHNFGHGYDFGLAGWKMLGNGPCDDNSVDSSWAAYNGAGDCVWAGAAHETMEAAHQSKRAIPAFTCLNVLQQYSAYSGYDLQSGGNDNGSDVQEVLQWRQTKGLTDVAGNVYKIGQHVSLRVGDIQELWAGAYLFDCVGIGVNLQAAQERAFPNTWNYDPSSSVAGGHYVPVMGNNGLITWARRVGFTQSFYEKLCDEAYAYIDTERYNAVTGDTSEGLADQDLEKYITMLTTV